MSTEPLDAKATLKIILSYSKTLSESWKNVLTKNWHYYPLSKVRIITVQQILSIDDHCDSDIHGFKVIVACKHILGIKFCKSHSFIEDHWYSYIKENTVLLNYKK